MNSFIPYEDYPNRICLDIVNHFKEYTKNKIVCDIGCGKADLLEYLKINNLCKDVIGIELNKKRYPTDRKYVINDNALKMVIPDADVYIFWIGVEFPYDKILNNFTKEKIIIYMDSKEEHQQIFSKYNGISLIKKINFEFDETKFINKNKLKEKKIEFEKLSKINKTWKIKGERHFAIYKYTP